MVFNAERTTGGASFALQLLLFSSLMWSVVWLLLTFSFLIFKATILPFPRAALPMEFVVMFLVLIINGFGFLIGIRGNLTEDVGALGVSLAFLFVAGVGALYYMWLQTYVMMLDLAFSAVFLGINCLCVFFGILALARASTHRNSVVPVVGGKQLDEKKRS